MQIELIGSTDFRFSDTAGKLIKQPFYPPQEILNPHENERGIFKKSNFKG